MIDKAFLVELFILVPYDFRGALRHTIFFALFRAGSESTNAPATFAQTISFCHTGRPA
jgi:hypothetical protein